MGWADRYIKKLSNGQTIKFRPRGNSMHPKIKSGNLCTVEPLTKALGFKDIVLCKVRGKQYLHFVLAMFKEGDKISYMIGNNKGHQNGWTNKNNIYGIVTKIE